MILPILYAVGLFGCAWLVQNNCNDCENNHEVNIEKFEKINYNNVSNKKQQKKKPSFYH
jgi:hypothetical protein